RWEEEKKLVGQVRELRAKLEGHAAAGKEPADAKGADAKGAAGKEGDGKARLRPDEEAAARADLARLQTELKKLQGEQPLVLPVVAGQAGAGVPPAGPGLPVGKMLLDEIKPVLTLKDKWEARITGQPPALAPTAQRTPPSRANLVAPRKPIGVFFMVGPSGVGK